MGCLEAAVLAVLGLVGLDLVEVTVVGLDLDVIDRVVGAMRQFTDTQCVFNTCALAF